MLHKICGSCITALLCLFMLPTVASAQEVRIPLSPLPGITYSIWIPDGGGARHSTDGRLLWPLTDNSYYTTYAGHPACDIPATMYTPIYAAANGEIIYAGWCGTYGYYVQIYHPDLNLTTAYAHQPDIRVTFGQHVRKGEQIGVVGSTGNSTGPHLHFEIYRGNASGVYSGPTCYNTNEFSEFFIM